MSTAPPTSFPHPGSPPRRPELPEGIIRPESSGPPGRAGGGPGGLDRSELPAWPAWAPFVAMLLTLVVALLGAAVIGVLVGLGRGDFDAGDPPPGVTIGGTIVQDLALIVAAIVLARLTAGRPTPAQFGLRLPPVGRAVWMTFAAWFSFIVFSAIYAAIFDITQADDLPDELGADDSALALVAVTVLVCVIAPITEEFFFRGFCFTALRRWLGLAGGAIVTGIIFGAIHLGGTEIEFIVPLAFFGIVLCLLYAWSGSLLPPMILHALNNSLALGVSQDWTWQIPLVMLGSCAVILALALPLARSRKLNLPPA